MKQYRDFQEVLSLLNSTNIPYLILRNYDNLLAREMYMDGHGDVDMLVADSTAVANLLEAATYPSHGNDGTHYYVIVDGEKVSLDLRHLGDGYYCRKWQRDMLARRVEHKGFFVMSDEDYFYSLVYHSILQKPCLSEEYRQRLSQMAKSLGLELHNAPHPNDFISLLEQFMKQHGYSYTYPVDTYVPLHTRYINKSMIEKNTKLSFEHCLFDTRVSLNNFMVKCYHLLRYGKFSYSLK